MRIRSIPLVMRWSLMLILVLALLPGLALAMEKVSLARQLTDAAAYGDLRAVKKLMADGPEKTSGSLPRECKES